MMRHKNKQAVLTAKRLRYLLDYKAATGKFRWRVQKPGLKAGTLAGCVGPKRYHIIRIDWKLYQAGRLAWLYKTGKWPKHDIDYINRDRSDIRWANLREITPAQRAAKASPRKNPLGVRGVWLLPHGKYAARIRVNGKKIFLGSFATVHEAGKAYARAAKKAYGQFANARSLALDLSLFGFLFLAI
jgi:hypothetical protein